MNYEIKSAKEASTQEIFFDKNTNKLSYKDKYGIIHDIESSGGSGSIVTDGLSITGNGTLSSPLVSQSSRLSFSLGLKLPGVVYNLAQLYTPFVRQYWGSLSYSDDLLSAYLDSTSFINTSSIGFRGDYLEQFIPSYGTIETISFKGFTGPATLYLTKFSNSLVYTTPIKIDLDIKNVGRVYVQEYREIEVIKLPETCIEITFTDLTAQKSLDLSTLKNPGSLVVQNNNQLLELDISGLLNSGASVDLGGSYWYIGQNPNLKTITLPTNLLTAPYNIGLDTNKLDQTTVDKILQLLVDLDGTDGKQNWGIYSENLDISGGGNSAPSPAGLANVAILVARGATITHN